LCGLPRPNSALGSESDIVTASSAEISLNDPVVKHMRADVSRLHVGETVGEALSALRGSPRPAARIVYFYVVDKEERLKGVIPAKSLLLSQPEARVDDIMIRQVIAIPCGATVLDACEFFVLHRFLAFPVVDAERRLLGAIDVELYTDELHDLDAGNAPSDDLFQLIGVHLARARQSNPVIALRTRFPWLLCNITGGIAAAVLCGLFHDHMFRDRVALFATLAMFIPVVLALAESVSIQSVSLATQLLRGESPSWRLILQKLRIELMVGVLLGGAAGLVVGLAALAWLGGKEVRLALSVLEGIAAGVVVAAVLGTIVPNVLHRFKLDPRVAAGPIVLALTDVITLLCYFSAAIWMLR
jgi:magnesium transporter